MNPTTAVIGVGAIGFGILLIWSAYKNVPLFGEGGVISRVLRGENPTEAVGKAGKFADSPGVGKWDSNPNKSTPKNPPSAQPPGSDGGIWV
jgi:hypothetical protein